MTQDKYLLIFALIINVLEGSNKESSSFTRPRLSLGQEILLLNDWLDSKLLNSRRLRKSFTIDSSKKSRLETHLIKGHNWSYLILLWTLSVHEELIVLLLGLSGLTVLSLSCLSFIVCIHLYKIQKKL